MPNPKQPKNRVVDGVARLVHEFLKRRMEKVESDISAFLNVNPFLLSSLREFHSFHTVRDLAEFLFISHMSQGHATGFGKLVDEKMLPQVFKTIKLNRTVRRERKLSAAAYNEIDHIVNPDSKDDWSLLSVKAGAWTIQDTAAHNLYSAFKQIGDFQLYGKEIVVGVFYGNKDSLTNKYDILKGINPRQQDQFVVLNHVRVLAGKAFWSWLNGDEEQTQEWVLEGTKAGSEAAFTAGVSTVIRDAPQRLAEELAKKYGISLEGNIDWLRLLIAIND